MNYAILIGVILLGLLQTAPAKADFMVGSAIIEFTADGPRQKDIDLISKSQESDYVVTEINEVIHPNASDETRRRIEDASQGGLLVTPDKVILGAGTTRLLRFVLLKNPDEQEHIYRAAVKPVIRGINNQTRVGLKILVGYEVLVIVRPVKMVADYNAKRDGRKFTVTNNGNTNILFENGQQCKEEKNCSLPPVVRVYPGQSKTVELPQDKSVDYSVWTGQETQIRHYN